MPRRILLLLAMLVAGGELPRSSQAEELRLRVPDDVKIVVSVDVQAIQQSAVGGPLFAAAKEEMLGKMADKGSDKGLSPEKIQEMLGFDPFEEIQSVVVAASDYDSPEESLIACVQLLKTSGNLEGLMLALPGYSVAEVDGRQIHSAKPDDDATVFGAIHADAAGSRTLVVAAQRDAIIQMLDALDGKAASEGNSKTVTVGGEESSLVTVDVFELPEDMIDEDGPQANVVKIVRSLAVRISESDGKLNVSTSVVAGAEKQAEQLEQMVKGLSAMVALAASSDAEDEDLQMVQKYLGDLEVTRNGSTLDVTLSLPVDEVQKLIADKMPELGK